MVQRRQRGAAARPDLPRRCRGRCTRCSSRWASRGPRRAPSSARSPCGAIAGLARSGARVAAHRAPKLRQRTLIVGSGLVADRLAERINDHPELGLELTGFIDDGAGDQGTAGSPASAA